jgi:hypothetical protein
MSRLFPLISFESDYEKTHGCIERRSIDVLPANAAGIDTDWPSVKHICRLTRFRQGKTTGEWKDPEQEVVYLIASRLHKPKRQCPAQHLFPYRVRSQNPEIRLAFANPRHRTISGRQEQGPSPVRRLIPRFTESP